MVEFYLTSANSSVTFTPTATTSGSARVKVNVTMIGLEGDGVTYTGELNFTNPAVINFVIDGYVAPFVASASAGSMLSMSPWDGGLYDQSTSTMALMHSNNPFQDNYGTWWGYNPNGVFVSADSESYWAMVNDAAQYVLQNEAPGQDLLLGGLGYEAVTQPPSFPLEPNVYVQISEEFGHDPYLNMDQMLKNYVQKGAQMGVYKDWTVFSKRREPSWRARPRPIWRLPRSRPGSLDHV